VTEQPFVKHWLHVGLVGLDGIKMSKSLGNLVFVDKLLERAEAGAVRLALLDHHYRFDWEWRDEDLTNAVERLERWRRSDAGDGSGGLEGVRAALDADLDTPKALSVLDEAAEAGLSVEQGAALLGVTL
jgi:L-cysteine:1D-myo-inositol 2-amino-2-deoxy-alpha-D-glucopyranoside ligase